MKNSLFTLILCAASTIQIAQADLNTTTVDQKQSNTPLIKSENLPNFHKVHDYLYRGGEPTSEGLSQLKDMGISTIIDLRSPQQASNDEPTAKKLGMNFINLPMNSQAPTSIELKTFIKAVEDAKQNHHPVFVHCAHGSDRTGCMVGVWRISHDNWSYDQAYQEMLKYYFNPKYTNLSDTVAKYAKNIMN